MEWLEEWKCLRLERGIFQQRINLCVLRRPKMKKEDQPIPLGSKQRLNSTKQEVMRREIPVQCQKEHSRGYPIVAENLNSIRQIPAPPLTISVTLDELYDLSN